MGTTGFETRFKTRFETRFETACRFETDASTVSKRVFWKTVGGAVGGRAIEAEIISGFLLLRDHQYGLMILGQ